MCIFINKRNFLKIVLTNVQHVLPVSLIIKHGYIVFERVNTFLNEFNFA